MKNGWIILNFVLLIAVGVLFYFHFNSKKRNVSQNKIESRNTGDTVDAAQTGCRIAYFEMDSIAANFVKAKEMQKELEKKEERMNSEITDLQNKYQEKYNNFQQHGPSMTGGQLDNARNELAQLSQRINDTKASLDQDYKTYYVQTQQEILSMIRKYCAEYNKDGRYSIIISNEPGLVFYKDSTMDITKDILEGLNKMYEKKKPEKNN